MKQILVACLILGLFPANGMAGIMYVNDMTQITLRTGPSVGRKVLDTLKSGSRVSELETASGWSRVRTSNGREGWVVSRYLTKSKPNILLLSVLEKKNEEMANKVAELLAANERIEKEKDALKLEIEGKLNKIEELTTYSKQLEEQTPDQFKSVKASYEKTLKAYEAEREKNEQLKVNLGKKEYNDMIKGALMAVGIMLLGFIFGYSSGKSRSRRSSYLG